MTTTAIDVTIENQQPFSSYLAARSTIGALPLTKKLSRSLGFEDTNWFTSNYHLFNILRRTIVQIEDFVYQGTTYVVYAYGSTKDLLPPEA
ncbi:hypothetical protein ACSBR1_008514 [Camellia fascicularis]